MSTVKAFKIEHEERNQKEESDDHPDRREHVSYAQLLRFFVPLGLTPLLIASSHSVVNAALARLPLASMSIAIFSIVKSVTNVVKSPGVVTRQTTVSLVDGGQSYRLVMKFIWGLAAVMLSLLLVLSFSPVGEWVLRTLLGITDPKQIALAYTGLRIACFLPIAEALRNSVQGVAISLEETNIMPVGTTLRFTAVALFLWWLVSTQAMSGVAAASLSWTVGIGLEGVLVGGYLFKRFGSPRKAAERIPRQTNDGAIHLLDVLKFFAPLAVMMLIAAWIRPMIQSGLARSTSPTITLAAYGVAWGLIVLISGPVRMLHQTSLIYTSDGVDDENWPRIKRFGIAVGAFAAVLSLAVALSPAGVWVMTELIAVESAVARAALPTLAAFSLYPLLRAWREIHWGVLMCQKRTSMIGGAKAANVLSVIGLLVLLFGPVQLGLTIPPAVAGALVYTVGEATETVLIWRHAVNHCHVQQPVRAQAAAAAD